MYSLFKRGAGLSRVDGAGFLGDDYRHWRSVQWKRFVGDEHVRQHWGSPFRSDYWLYSHSLRLDSALYPGQRDVRALFPARQSDEPDPGDYARVAGSSQVP